VAYQFKTPPLAHQLADFEATRDLEAWGHFHEQGTGKAKIGVDTCAALYQSGQIDGVLVIAPNGVHRNWVTDEIVKHCPDEVSPSSLAYYASRAGTRAQARAGEELLAHRGLAWLAMTYDGVMTPQGRALARAFLNKRRCLMCLDEAHKIKNPAAHRTKAIRAAVPLARYRRIMSGTPVANSPFDVYAPVLFLDPNFWVRELGIHTFLTFQHEFGVFGTRSAGPGGRKEQFVEGYKHLDVLHATLAKISSRVLKEDVLDLPPKVYTKRYFEMDPDQAKFYKSLRDEYVARFDSGEECTAMMAMTRLLRLQQVTSGYVPSDDDKVLRPVGRVNRRLKLLEEVVEDFPGQKIVWCRFQQDVAQVCALFGDRARRADGVATDRERDRALDDFHAGRAEMLVSNPATTGISTGLTLNEAKTIVYYNCSYSYVDRVQSEDRCHRIGQDQSPSYVDFVAEDSVDERVIDALISKHGTAAEVNGDRLREWLR